MDVTKLDIRENKFADHARHVNPLRKEVPAMPREKFKTLTEQMFYILLCLCEERCGIEILDSVKDLTDDRVKIGSGTLYDLLEQFTKEGMICETKIEGRRRSYRITEKGRRMLDAEYRRLSLQAADYARICKGGTPWK